MPLALCFICCTLQPYVGFIYDSKNKKPPIRPPLPRRVFPPLTKPLALSKEYPGKKTEECLFNKRAKYSVSVLELVRITNFCLFFDDCFIDINPYMPTPALHQTPQ